MTDDREPDDASRRRAPPAPEAGPAPAAGRGESSAAVAPGGAAILADGSVPEARRGGPETSLAGPLADEKHPSDPPRLGRFRVLGGVLFGGILGLLGGWLVCAPEDPPPERRDELRDSPNVVVAIQDLARLETTSYHVERVIDLVARQRQLFGLVEAEDAILLVAAGDVVAGVDLTRMEDGDVLIDPDSMIATVTLPEPEIFSARLDNERTYVHTRDTDLTASRDPHLETRARREAERTLREAAIEAGIMDRARVNAEAAIGTLVRSLGYDQVAIRWRDADANPER